MLDSIKPVKLEPRFPLLLACFVLSGFAGLIYETVWTQQFALVFGTSELALATVLSAYMAGLALGAVAAGRWAGRPRRPLLVYAVLELGIGLAALAVPAMITGASRLQVVLLGSTELPEAAAIGSALFYLASSFLILLVPTTLMGATLPVLARQAVRRPRQIGRRIGTLYAANTAGAAAGVLAAAFLLLPRIGLGPTVWLGAAVNAAVFVLAVLLARGAPEPADDQHPPPAHAGAQEHHSPANGWILPLILVSGAVSFTWEILWTRLLGHLLGGSVYAFATMLATFLVGLALGSAAAARLASDRERARRGFATAQIAIAGLSYAAFATVDRLPDLARIFADFEGLIASGAVLCAATLLPGAIAIGATFPFAVRILARDTADAARAGARIFAWNTAGAIAGSLGAGYLLLPALKFAAAAAVATAVSLVLALATALVRPRRKILATAAAAGLLVVATVRPGTPWQVLRRGALGPKITPGQVVYYGVGRGATVLLHEQRQGWRLTTNGLPESFIGAPWQRHRGALIAHWLTLLPFAARPDTRSLLVVGLGGGVTAEDVPRAAEEIHVVELEPEVVDANRLIAGRRRVDPLADPRLRLHINDARGALRLTSRRFDAIVSQPSHPWTSGACHLFSREFLALVRQRLAPDGVFVQWMGLSFVDQVLVRSMVATAAEVFPRVELYQPGQGAILLLASAATLDLEATAGRALGDEPRLWAHLGVLCREDLLAARVLDAPGARRLAAEGRPSTDFLNLFRTRSPKILRKPLEPAALDRMLAPYDALPAGSADVDHLLLIRRLIRRGAADRARRLAEALPDPVARATAIGLAKLARDQSAGELELRDALRLAPGSGDPRALEALYGLLVARYRTAIRGGEPVSFTEHFASDPGAAVIAGWRASGAGDRQAVRRLEQRLAAIDPRHALFEEATRLRVEWRVESGEPEAAAEALNLLEALLVPAPRPADLLLQARAAAAAGDARKALAAVDEALPRLERGSGLARQAAKILRSLGGSAASLRGDQTGHDVDEWRRELRERLRRPRRGIMAQD